jgi:hypothetical protein
VSPPLKKRKRGGGGDIEKEVEKEENARILSFKYAPCYLFSNTVNKEFYTQKIIKKNFIVVTD